MSLILDALKKLRRDKTERSADIPSFFIRRRGKRRFKLLKIIYLALSAPALIFGAYIMTNNLKQLTGGTGAAHPIRPLGISSELRRPSVERKPKGGDLNDKTSRISKLIPLQDLLPSHPLRRMEPVYEPISEEPLLTPPKMEVELTPPKTDRPPHKPLQSGDQTAKAAVSVKPQISPLTIVPHQEKPIVEKLPQIKPEKEKAKPYQDNKREGKPSKEATRTTASLNPANKADYHFNLGVFYQSRGDLRRALREYKETVKLDPSNARAHNNMGVIYKEMGFLDKAIEEYEKALQIDPNYVKALNNLGVVLYMKGELEDAAELLRKSIKIEPGNAASYVNLGLVLKKQRLVDQAIDMFKKAISIDRRCIEAYYNLALALEEKGRIDMAVWYYERFLELADEERYFDLKMGVRAHLDELSGKKGGRKR